MKHTYRVLSLFNAVPAFTDIQRNFMKHSRSIIHPDFRGLQFVMGGVEKLILYHARITWLPSMFSKMKNSSWRPFHAAVPPTTSGLGAKIASTQTSIYKPTSPFQPGSKSFTNASAMKFQTSQDKEEVDGYLSLKFSPDIAFHLVEKNGIVYFRVFHMKMYTVLPHLALCVLPFLLPSCSS